MRTIRTHGDGQSSAVADVLQTVLVAEVVSPSERLWLISPWISDIPVIDNRAAAFTALHPTWGHRNVSLVDVLLLLAEPPNTAQITVVTRDETPNTAVLNRLRTSEVGPDRLRVVLDPKVHEKTLVTDRVLLTGSMNFTHGGTTYNQESLSVNADRSAIAQAHIDLEKRHGGPA